MPDILDRLMPTCARALKNWKMTTNVYIDVDNVDTDLYLRTGCSWTWLGKE